jgi:N-acetylglutamate synthase-like GNAT family acetyltransferase
MKEAGDHKEKWFQKMKEKGLRVKVAVIDKKICAMIQYTPAENSLIEGNDLCFINCIWVHGYKKGVGNFQKKGIGKALLQAAENDIKSINKKGVVAWGISLPFWMKASWYKKQGYKKIDKSGMAVLLWKPFQEGANPPRWIKEQKHPQKGQGRVNVTSFINGWCPAQNLVHERAKRASREFGELVEFQEIPTFEKEVLVEWGISDGLFIDGKQVRSGPPPSYEKIRKKIAKRTNRIVKLSNR